MLVLLIAYGLGYALLPTLSPQATLLLHFSHALAWCLIHYFGLGLLLRAQSESKYLVRHYLKNYPYSLEDGGQTALVEAFTNWKAIYNLSLCMCYGESILTCIRLGAVYQTMISYLHRSRMESIFVPQ